MKKINKFAVFIVSIVLISIAGSCASTHKTEGTGEYFDDSMITTKVKTAIFDEPELKSSEINVETFKGVVQLSGFVGTRANINKAVSVAHDVKGVTSVKNDLRLK